MKNRLVSCVAPSLKITTFEIPDIDLDIYLQHVKSMQTVNCVFVDDEVAYVGMFDSETISKAKKKLKKLLQKENKDV
jgi:hypothetical protein